MISLDLNHPVFCRAPCSALPFELLCERFEAIVTQWDTRDNGDSLAIASFGVEENPYDSVTPGRGIFRVTGAPGSRFAAFRADSSDAGGIDSRSVKALKRRSGTTRELFIHQSSLSQYV